MTQSDFRRIAGKNKILIHSAKGSEWERHLYAKKIDGKYYYPSGYENGRTVDSLPGGGGGSSEEKEEEKETGDLSEDDVHALALQVIRGDFGNGQIRKDLLGENYDVIQTKVNELMRAGDYGSAPMNSEKTEETAEKGKKAAAKATQASKGIDMDKVLSVYKDQAKRKSKKDVKHSGLHEEDFLAHYGVSKKNGAKIGSGRYPLGSTNNKGQRIQAKSSVKMNRYEKKINRKQARATKKFSRFERKSVSFLSSEEGIERARLKAVRAQRRVNRLEMKGSRYYTRISKKLNKLSMDVPSDVVSLGEEYLRRTKAKSQSMYLQMMTA